MRVACLLVTVNASSAIIICVHCTSISDNNEKSNNNNSDNFVSGDHDDFTNSNDDNFYH